MPASMLACIDFTKDPVGQGPNTRGGASFRVFDPSGNQLPNTQIINLFTFTGLSCERQLEIRFRRPVGMVCMSLVRGAAAGKVGFFSPAGSTVGSVPTTLPQNVVQHVACNSTATISRIVVIAPADETIVLELCAG
jgi:hypothetical protein